MRERWSKAQAWAWQDATPWIVGFNYIPSNCINFVEIWQEEGFEDVFATMERELTLAEETGYNSVRMLLPLLVWQEQRDGFIQRIQRFLAMADQHGFTMMPVFFDDCCVPRSLWQPPYLGKQPEPVWGHHGGTVATPFDGKQEAGYNHFDDTPEVIPQMEAFVKDIISTFGQDARIIAWDLWNEPGNSKRGTLSMAVMEQAFAWARAMDPMQPLTSCSWGQEFYEDHFKFSEIELRAIALSDVTSFHFYGDLARTEVLVEDLKQFGRPLMITEWLHRPFRNLFETHLPLFKREKIGCYQWGLVTGKTQTNEPWDYMRSMPGLDLSRWQHDLFYTDGTPYDADEIALIRSLTGKQA